MFLLLCAVLSVAIGCGVCAFGIWAFLKGQRNALLVKSGGLPDGVFADKKASPESGSSPNISEQLGAMFKGGD